MEEEEGVVWPLCKEERWEEEDKGVELTLLLL